MGDKMLKVYFVDDDELIITELKCIIDWSKYDFEICGYSNDPIFAIDDILEKKPSLVICDVQMDELNGLDLAKKVTDMNDDISFCFLSAFDKFDYAVEAIRIGAIRYLKKPIKKEELITLLKEIREKEIVKFEHQLSTLLASTNPYQNYEVAKLFEKSSIFKSNIPFRIVVLYGDIKEFNPILLGASYITLYDDSVTEMYLVYNVNLELIKELIRDKNISAGVSAECNNYNNIVDLLKTAINASKNKFITNKNELIVYKENPNVEKVVNMIKSINHQFELKKFISDLKNIIISNHITSNNIQFIYQTIIYSMIRLGLIEADVDLINVSVLHFYQSIEQMIDDLLMNYKENINHDFNDLLLNEVKEDLKKNLSKKLSLSDYARKYGYNTSYFSQWFKKTCGISFVEYVITERIELAKNLIKYKKHASLKNVAIEVGYDDYYHFSKIFKKYTGLSPIEFQNKIHN